MTTLRLNSRHATWMVLVAFSGAIAAYFLPNAVAEDAIEMLAVAIIIGVAAVATGRLTQHRRAWRWIVAGNAMFLAGDAIYSLLERVLGYDPYPSVADIAYIAGYPMIGLGLVMMGRTGSPERNRGAWVDASIVALGATALMWALVIAPTVADATATALERWVALSYASGDLVLIAALAVLFGRQISPTRSSGLLMASLVTMLVADVLYAVAELGGSFTAGNPVDALWLASYATMALAVIDHESADRPTPIELRGPRLTAARSVTLMICSIVAPVVLLFEVRADHIDNALALIVATIAIFILVVIRLQLVADELEASRRELAHEAGHDGLTGLANRKRFLTEVESAIHAGRHEAVVLYLDLDDFKTVNDVHGHPAGDALLVAIAERLRTVTRHDDHVARLGGDEFAVLLVGAQARQSSLVAEELLAVLRMPVELPQTVVHPAASIGIVEIDGERDVDELMRRADVAMYTAKRAGKDRWRPFASDVSEGAKTWLELRADLPYAVDREQLSLEFQPVVLVDDGRIVAFEALVRWDHHRHGRIAPDRFIPIAEESRLIDEIGRWVLTEATTTFANAPGDGIDVSVNISPRQLERWGFIDDVRRALETSGLDPARLVIEVTESASIDQVDQVAAVLTAVRSLGVRVALDDLGAGFASLRHLGTLPIDIVKLDRSFMRRPMQERDLLPGLVDLIRALHLIPVVEGVETRAHHDLTRQLGVRLAQGYRYGAPTPFDQAWALVEAQRGALDESVSG
ncbi:MAG: EAL domain-containing protein [Ilumatobacter sp.]|nr:EAL domain-containing protein [Ilumatobacter sp.]